MLFLRQLRNCCYRCWASRSHIAHGRPRWTGVGMLVTNVFFGFDDIWSSSHIFLTWDAIEGGIHILFEKQWYRFDIPKLMWQVTWLFLTLPLLAAAFRSWTYDAQHVVWLYDSQSREYLVVPKTLSHCLRFQLAAIQFKLEPQQDKHESGWLIQVRIVSFSLFLACTCVNWSLNRRTLRECLVSMENSNTLNGLSWISEI